MVSDLTVGFKAFTSNPRLGFGVPYKNTFSKWKHYEKSLYVLLPGYLKAQ